MFRGWVVYNGLILGIVLWCFVGSFGGFMGLRVGGIVGDRFLFFFRGIGLWGFVI